jgi:hypothetical protein
MTNKLGGSITTDCGGLLEQFASLDFCGLFSWSMIDACISPFVHYVGRIAQSRATTSRALLFLC